jgi:hypothetical protein
VAYCGLRSHTAPESERNRTGHKTTRQNHETLANIGETHVFKSFDW